MTADLRAGIEALAERYSTQLDPARILPALRALLAAHPVQDDDPDAAELARRYSRVLANLNAARAVLNRVRAVCAQIEAMPIPADPGMSQTAITGRIVATITRAVRAALDSEVTP